MTDPLLSLESDRVPVQPGEQNRVPVQPGGQARVSVRIKNPGSIVEGYRLDVLGDGPSQWAEVIPPRVSIYPQQETTIVVVFSPPEGAGVAGGSWPFAVRARSEDDPNGSAVVEGDLDIGRLVGLQAKLVPVTSSGRWRGRHTVQLSNWGNTAVRLRIIASDPDEVLGFLVRPPEVELQLGSSATVRLLARTRHPVLRGTAPRLPFTVTAERLDAVATPGPTPVGSAPDRPVLNGALKQRPILSGTAMLAGLVLLAGIVAGGVFTLKGPVGAAPSAYRDVSTPPQARIISATSTGPTTIDLVWEPIKDVDQYKITVTDPAVPAVVGSPLVAAPISLQTVPNLQPAREYCFDVTALDDDLPGPASEQACATTMPSASASPSSTGSASASPTGSESGSASPSGSATASPSGGPTDSTSTASPGTIPQGTWVQVVAVVPSSSPGRAVEWKDQLEAAGVPEVGIFVVDQYQNFTIPNLNLNADASVVYVGVKSQPAELLSCSDLQKVKLDKGFEIELCRAAQPNP